MPPQPAYILHSRPYRDSSLILELLTPDYGRIGCIARGARRDKQRRQKSLQPFAPLLVTLLGRHSLKTLGPLENAGQAYWLKGRAVYAGLYANELLVRLLQEGEAQLAVFAAYQTLLGELGALRGEVNEELEAPLRRFELALLTALGCCPQLNYSTLDGGAVHAGRVYRLTLEDGLVPVALPEGQAPRGNDFKGETLLALASVLDGAELVAPLMGEAKRLTRALLAPQLGDRPLRSRELFRQVYSLD
nr:DNA repair protein RecO [Microbulbifer celer]